MFGFIEAIIAQAPKLKMVLLEFGKYNQDGAEAACFEAISERRILLEKLTHLQLRMTDMMSKSKLSKLSYIHGAKLKVVKVNYVSKGHTSETLRQRSRNAIQGFLQSQAESLVSLEIEQGRGKAHPFTILVPALGKLEQLKITRVEDFIFLPLLSSRNFPALKCVNMSVSNWREMLPYIFQEGDRFNSVEELILGELPRYHERNSISEVATLFPNVSKLEINPITSRMVKDVYQSFPTLVELSLTANNGFDFMDKIITGLKEFQLQALESEMNARPHQKEESCRRNLTRAAKARSIASLSQLETLRLRTGLWDSPIEFGYASSFVLKSMDSLKCLDLGIRCFPESNERTQAVLLDFREKFCVTFDEPPEPPKMRIKVEGESLSP